ncbi:hypothetical protein LTR93_004232 [Exophiala xenobiotica]|nr:hypothetical protein LTR93_004232 [Exophiala xenobiotica]
MSMSIATTILPVSLLTLTLALALSSSLLLLLPLPLLLVCDTQQIPLPSRSHDILLRPIDFILQHPDFARLVSETGLPIFERGFGSVEFVLCGSSRSRSDGGGVVVLVRIVTNDDVVDQDARAPVVVAVAIGLVLAVVVKMAVLAVNTVTILIAVAALEHSSLAGLAGLAGLVLSRGLSMISSSSSSSSDGGGAGSGAAADTRWSWSGVPEQDVDGYAKES